MSLTVERPHKRRLDSGFGATPKEVAIHATLYAECLREYNTFVTSLKSAMVRGDIQGQANALDKYRRFAKQKERGHGVVGPRSKYYSSILEELPVLLTEDLVRTRIDDLGLSELPLHLGSKNCVIRIAANPDGTVFHERKNIDFAFCVDTEGLDRWVPLVGLEVKKYVDKTMFGTILETYKSLQVFRPKTYYGFLAEDEARRQDVVDNSIMYRNEFILSGKTRARSDLTDTNPEEFARFSTGVRQAIEEAMPLLKAPKASPST